FFISFIIAAVFWLLQSFSQTYQSNIRVPIQYAQIPEGLALNKPLPDILEIRFESSGWGIMKFKRFQRNQAFVLNLNKFPEQKSVSTSNFIISNLPEEMASIKILMVSPEVLNLGFEKRREKEVPVVPDLKVSFNSQYGLAGLITIKPEKVLVSGPESEINKINEVKTEFRKYDELEDKVIDIIGLVDLGSKNIKYDQEEFELTIPVEQLAEGTLTIPISMPQNLQNTISLIPEKVQLKFQAAVSLYNTVSQLDFDPFIKMEDFESTNDDKLKVHCKVKQDFIYKVSVSPEYVDYILIK
nr:YbbR-like domain-containing protein [Bacteroidota bacterium]